MIINNSIIGNWKGNYRYLHNDIENKVGIFSMEVLELKGSHFIGIIIDDTEHKGSSIKGQIINSQIVFIKTYFSIDLINEKRKVTVNHKHSIKYEGELTAENEFLGTWFRPEQKLMLDGKEYQIKAEQGSWSARKIVI